MSKAKKGREFELWAKKFLLQKGHLVFLTNKSVFKVRGKVFCKSNDIFDAFDILAVSQGTGFRLIQCSCDQTLYKRASKLKELSWLSKFAQLELWIKRPNGQVQIFKLEGDNLIPKIKIIRGKIYEQLY